MNSVLVFEIGTPVVIIALAAAFPTIKRSEFFQKWQLNREQIASTNAALKEKTKEKKQQEVERRKQEIDFAQTGDLLSVDNHGVILQKGEIAYTFVPSASLLEKRVVGYSGKTSGVSVRVAKGVTARTSGSKGRANYAMVAVASGRLVTTNQRLIFVGDNKSVTLIHKKITAFDALQGGVRVADAHKSYNFSTGSGHGYDLFNAITCRMIAEAART